MLTTATASLCARQAPVAVGLLLRGRRAACLLPPRRAGRAASVTARGHAFSAEGDHPEYSILQYEYTRESALTPFNIGVRGQAEPQRLLLAPAHPGSRFST